MAKRLSAWVVRTRTDEFCDTPIQQNLFTLNNSSTDVLACEVRRALHGHPTVDTHTFVVQAARNWSDKNGSHHEDGVSAQIEWCAGTDTGSIELVSVVGAPPDGSLVGLNKLDVTEYGDAYTTVLRANNHWTVPLYVCVEITEFGNQTRPPMKRLIDPSWRWDFWEGSPADKPVVRWRAAEPQRLSMYGPEPRMLSASDKAR